MIDSDLYFLSRFGGCNQREIDSVANYLWHEHGGIFQTPEGFTNEYGYHILFSSPDTVSGRRWSGLLQADGNWVPFKMDLGDSGRRERFLRENYRRA